MVMVMRDSRTIAQFTKHILFLHPNIPSFTPITSTDDFSLVEDNGSELAEAFAAEFPFVFNSDAGLDSSTPIETFDRRSDNKVINWDLNIS